MPPGRGGHACDVKVIESAKLPTIGVGEGTTAVFRQMLQQFGLDEAEFLAATGATIKFGIRHRNWRRLGHSYDRPIDDPHRVAGLPASLPASLPDSLAGRPALRARARKAARDLGAE